MNLERAIKQLDEAIDAARATADSGSAQAYPGLTEVLGQLRAMREDLDAGTFRFVRSGVGRHIADQWPMSDTAEKVAGAIHAYERYATRR